jgi:ubiquinone/menaquinone biosynthesis C-methylase UbiE
VKMGDRIVQIGCADGARLAAVAAKVGLSGRAVAVVPDAAAAARAQKGASAEGVLVEIETTAPTALPLDDAAFDLAIVDDTNGLLSQMSDAESGATLSEVLRVLRPGGRAMVIGSLGGRGLGALFGGGSGPTRDPQPALERGGFRFVRHLAEREGLSFVEGLKART